MGDVTDLEEYRNKIRDSIEREDDESLIHCPECGDMLNFIVTVRDATDVDEGGPYAIVCQHCNEPIGSAYMFSEDDEDEG